MWLRLIGPPCLFSALGQPTHLATKKQIALLVYLHAASGSRGVRREEIVELLWPTLSTARGKQSLSQGLSEIRNKLGKNAVTRGGTYINLLTTLETDVTNLDKLDPTSNQQAMALEGLEDVSGTHFAHWVEAARVSLTNDVRTRLNQEIDQLRSRGDRVAVRERAKQLYGIDSMNLRALSILAEDAAQRGEMARAISLLDNVLQNRTDWEPEDLTILEGLRERLKSSNVVLSGRGQTRSPKVLVGRRTELKRMHAAATRNQPHSHTAILLIGPPGIGKSALAEQFVADKAADGDFCLRVACGTPGEPHTIVKKCIDVLSQHPELGSTEPESLSELSRVAPVLRKRYPGIPKHCEETDATGPLFARSLVNAIAAVTSQPVVTMFVDDVDLADPASLEMLEALLGKTLPFRLTLVATHSKETTISGHNSQSLERVSWTDVLPLHGLSADSARELIHRTSARHSPVARDKFDDLVRWCRGSPFLVTTALSDLDANRENAFYATYRAHDLEYRWDPPTDVRALLEREFRIFWNASNDVTDLLAISAQPLDAMALHRITLHTEERTRSTIQIGLDLGILEATPDGVVFPAGILRAFAASRLSLSRWRYCHRALAREQIKCFEEAGGAPPLDAITHLGAAGAYDEAVRLAGAIARRYLDESRPGLAEEVLEKVWHLQGEVRESTRLLMARVKCARGNYDASKRCLQQIASNKLTDQEKETFELLRAEVNVRLHESFVPHGSTLPNPLRAANLTTRLSSHDPLLLASETAVLQRNWRVLSTITQRAHDNLLTLAFCQMVQGSYKLAIENFRRSTVLLAHRREKLQQARAFNGIGTCAFALGQFSTALAAFKKAYELACQADNKSFAAAIASNLAASYTDYDFPRKAGWWLGRSAPALDERQAFSMYHYSVLANQTDHAVTHGNVIEPRVECGSQAVHNTHLQCARADLLLATDQWGPAMKLVEAAERSVSSRPNVIPRFVPGFDSPHLARLMYLKAWHHGALRSMQRMNSAWPNNTMSVGQRAELYAVFAWCAQQTNGGANSRVTHRFNRRAADLVQRNGLTGVLRRLNAIGVLSKELKPLTQ